MSVVLSLESGAPRRATARRAAALPAAFAVLGFGAAGAHAQMILNNAGAYIDYSVQNTAAGGANANFQGDGQLTQPGGGITAVSGNPTDNGGPIAQLGVSPANPFNITNGFGFLNSAAAGNWGGATDTVFSNNNGVFATNLSLGDALGAGKASVSYTSFSGTWTAGAGGFAGAVGSFLSLVGTLPNPANGAFLAAGLTTDIAATSGANTEHFFSNLVFGYTGGAAPQVLSATSNFQNVPGNPVSQNTTNFINLGNNSILFGMSSLTPAIFLAGDTVTISGALTLVADPASFDLPTLGQDQLLNLPEPAFGEAGNPVAPEPGSLALIAAAFAPAGIFVIRRRGRAA